METLYFIAGILGGAVVAYIVFYLHGRLKTVPKTEFDSLAAKHNEAVTASKLHEERAAVFVARNTELSEKLSAKEEAVVHFQNLSTRLETQVKNSEAKAGELAQQLSDERETNRCQQNEIRGHQQKIAELIAVNHSISEKLETHKAEVEALQKTAHLQFEKIANQLLEEKSAKFTDRNKQNIETLLNPLKEDINAFKTKVEETYDRESKERFSLERTVKSLIEQTGKVSAEANNLATALKGNPQKRGNWGEVVLERILESSGLTKDREYVIQQSVRDEEGNTIRPDVLVNLPDKRIIVIDSKVSLVDYDRFVASEGQDEQERFLRDHLKSMKTHIDQLSAKKYDDLEASLNYTMMFVPIESAYAAAIQKDADLWTYAYDKRIILVNPTNLIALLKLISDLWKREWQNRNAMDIVKRGESLYEKLVGFTETFSEVGRSIQKSQDSYDKAVKQLKEGKGNLINQAILLKNLGLKSDKRMPPQLLPVELANEDDAEVA